MADTTTNRERIAELEAALRNEYDTGARWNAAWNLVCQRHHTERSKTTELRDTIREMDALIRELEGKLRLANQQRNKAIDDGNGNAHIAIELLHKHRRTRAKIRKRMVKIRDRYESALSVAIEQVKQGEQHWREREALVKALEQARSDERLAVANADRMTNELTEARRTNESHREENGRLRAECEAMRENQPMTIPPCGYCHATQTELGALLFSPPDADGLCRKMHVCARCYLNLIGLWSVGSATREDAGAAPLGSAFVTPTDPPDQPEPKPLILCMTCRWRAVLCDTDPCLSCDAYSNWEKEPEPPKPERDPQELCCQQCGGSGGGDEPTTRCGLCGGTGETPIGRGADERYCQCLACGGSGKRSGHESTPTPADAFAAALARAEKVEAELARVREACAELTDEWMLDAQSILHDSETTRVHRRAMHAARNELLAALQLPERKGDES